MTQTIADIMTTDLVTFQPDQNIHQAIHILLDKRISGAPVIDETGSLVGILSRKDCLKIAFSASYHDSWAEKVRDYMVSEVKTMDAGVDITSAAQMFLESSFRRYPVMRDGALVGIVSRHDILSALRKYM